MDFSKVLQVSQEVKEAIKKGKGVVALESTIISHGMPYPQNVETALKVEEVIRSHGAVPATIAVIEGKAVVGCSPEQIERLGKKGLSAYKVSRRDLPIVIAEGADGATTVAGTMILAALAGIKVFATGGIGGVHRGAAETFDISADLEELSRTPVAVVCAGAKSILDIGLTLEYLETKGVPFIGYQTDTVPAFYTRESGFKAEYRMDEPKQIADIILARKALGLTSGMVIGNPVPKKFSMNPEYIDGQIAKALEEAEEKNICGKEITPFLLDKIQKLTEGKSLQTNIELVLSNAALGAEIAKLCG